MSGYSKSPETARAMLPFLGPVLEGNLCAWTVEWGRADHWAYKIREALYIARLWRGRLSEEQHGAEFVRDMQALDRAAERYRVAVVSPEKVQLEVAKGSSEAQVLAQPSLGTTQGLEEAGQMPSVYVGPQSAEGIQLAWRALQPSNAPLHFPNANLAQHELELLHEWATPMGLVMVVADGALTLQRPTKDLARYAWAPGASEDVPDEEFPFA